MKSDPERIYEEAVRHRSTAETLWLMERIIRELRQGPSRKRTWRERFWASLGELDPNFERPSPLPSADREPLDDPVSP